MREYGGEDLFNKYINILANGSADVMDDFQYPEARVQRSLTSKLEDAERAHDKVLEENVRLTLEVEALKKALSHATTEVHVPDINKD